MKIIGVGDNVVDVYLDQNKMYPGGNSVNVAVLTKRAGAEASAYIGIIGDDKTGDLIKNSLAEEGLDLSHLRVIHGSNGRNAIQLHEGDNDRMFVGSNFGITDGKTRHFQPIFEAKEVVDTLGAGDTYISAFLLEYFTSNDFVKAAERGGKIALETLKYNGAFGHPADADISGITMHRF